MKKLIFVGLFIMMMVMLSSCSAKGDSPKLLSKEGIAPYDLSESEKYILNSFAMDDTSQIISFNAPKEAVSLQVNAYRLDGGGNWESIGGGAVSIGTDRKPADKIAGTFTMQLKENFVIDFHINVSGRASYKTDEISLESEILSSVKGFLPEYQPITMDTEIPVALMVYDSGTTMKTYSLQDYFEQSKFEDMDLVQFITLVFTDK